jgi:hypothetical protein
VSAKKTREDEGVKARHMRIAIHQNILKCLFKLCLLLD